jgi:hypothetical protein
MRSACRRTHHGCMDILAVALALITFAVLYALIFGIERI